ncbi:MAG: NYN domain-containing protein [Ignavibacteria bacterium]|nr:NYN domain-containing protein [Ignavibacteria bacterium]
MRKFLIDGNNILNSYKNLKEVFDKDKAAARNKLVQLIQDYFFSSKNEATIFFDGFEEDGHSFKKVSQNVFMKFSRTKPADKIIRETIDKEKNKRILIVVSSDNEVIDYARINACKVQTSIEFSAKIAKSKKVDNLKFNPRLSDSEINYWLKIFKNN